MTAAIVALLCAIAPVPSALAQEPSHPMPPGAKSIAIDPARDAALRTFLQKHFKIANPDWIKLGTVVETPLSGLYARTLQVVNDQGQSVGTMMFFDKNVDHIVIGQYLDLGREPWGRMDMSKIHLSDHPTLGPASAPITIVEFADFECPYCAHAFSVMETMANTTYKDKIKVIFKAYPLNVHPWAVTAAKAAECARLQNPDSFWQFARYFYSNQGSINPKNIQEHVDKEAKNLKLDDAALKACMESAETANHVKQDQQDGESVKVSSTPTFFVNGIPVVGLPDNKVLDFVINSELAEIAAAKAAAH